MNTERVLATDDLCRSVPFKFRSGGDVTDGHTLDGYGAMFNSPTRINSWEGVFNETIAPGAFRKSLRENTPRMQFDHGNHPLIGSIPIGRYDTVEEDPMGLHVVGRLSENWLVQPVRDAIAEGAIDGMSFRFSVVKDQWNRADGTAIKDEAELMDLIYNARDEADIVTRILKEVRCTEVGPVVWPAYRDTSVAVRSKTLTVDLSSKSSLARAAFVLDAAVRNTVDQDLPRETQDAPSSTDGDAVRHSEEPTDTSPTAGSHSSEPVELDEVTQRKLRMRATSREAATIISVLTKKGAPDGH